MNFPVCALLCQFAVCACVSHHLSRSWYGWLMFFFSHPSVFQCAMCVCVFLINLCSGRPWTEAAAIETATVCVISSLIKVRWDDSHFPCQFIFIIRSLVLIHVSSIGLSLANSRGPSDYLRECHRREWLISLFHSLLGLLQPPTHYLLLFFKSLSCVSVSFEILHNFCPSIFLLLLIDTKLYLACSGYSHSGPVLVSFQCSHLSVN